MGAALLHAPAQPPAPDRRQSAADRARVHLALVEATADIRAFIRRHAFCAQKVDDIYQETVTRVLERSQAAHLDNPAAYATQIARTLCRKPGRETPHEPADFDLIASARPSPEDEIHHRRRCDRMMDAIARLPALRRDILLRRRWRGQSRADIARELGISEETVKKHMSRALDALESHVGPDGSEALR
ncbi:sigma-70 family RNA polymerase sigma factor [Glycocaulis profundi]|nr:sigma-70 family RNA polymerase sigma factor [Glycocaulis profundi]